MIDPQHFLHERYRSPDQGSRLRQAYYTAKPLLPRRVQLALRRAYAPLQARQAFPAWPIEPILVHHREERLRREIRDSDGGSVPLVNLWPKRRRFATVLTHDVEGPAGVDNVMRVADLERRYGFVSSWNFVADWYHIPEGLFDYLRAAGCEIGLHGIRHDGRLFRDRAHFEADLPLIRDSLKRWGAVGFRSPATHRNAEWMSELPVLYDSSFPDTDPFEPQPGGCCSILPFHLGDVIELPITLVQDHTLFEILRDQSVDRWVHKSEWIIRHRGLINIIVHPDYVIEQTRLDVYEAFLAWLAAQEEGWHALPRDVARWWRQRETLEVQAGPNGTFVLAGRTDFDATVAYAREEGDEVVIDA
jgi:peptidoglycan/xylan/chitin deacetylase (PgdA/CDA1 family)